MSIVGDFSGVGAGHDHRLLHLDHFDSGSRPNAVQMLSFVAQIMQQISLIQRDVATDAWVFTDSVANIVKDLTFEQTTLVRAVESIVRNLNVDDANHSFTSSIQRAAPDVLGTCVYARCKVNYKPHLVLPFPFESVMIRIPISEGCNVLAFVCTSEATGDEALFTICMRSCDYDLVTSNYSEEPLDANGNPQFQWSGLCSLLTYQRMYQACQYMDAHQPPCLLSPTSAPSQTADLKSHSTDDLRHMLATTTAAGTYCLLIDPEGSVGGSVRGGDFLSSLAVERARRFPEQKILLCTPTSCVQALVALVAEEVAIGGDTVTAVGGSRTDIAIAVAGTTPLGTLGMNHVEGLQPDVFVDFLQQQFQRVLQSIAALPSRLDRLTDVYCSVRHRLNRLLAPSSQAVDASITSAIRQLIQWIDDADAAVSKISTDDQLAANAQSAMDSIHSASDVIQSCLYQRAQIIVTTLVGAGDPLLTSAVSKIHTLLLHDATLAPAQESFIPYQYNPDLYVLAGESESPCAPLPEDEEEKEEEKEGEDEGLRDVPGCISALKYTLSVENVNVWHFPPAVLSTRNGLL